MKEEDLVTWNHRQRNHDPEDELPDMASMSTWSCISVSEDTSESSFACSSNNVVETFIEESQVQAEFAEQTAKEMKEWINFWDAYKALPVQNLSRIDLPKNSLAWDETSVEEEEVKPLTPHVTSDSCESAYLEQTLFASMTPQPCRRARRQQSFTMNEDALLPTLVPCTPCSPDDENEDNTPLMIDYDTSNRYDLLPVPRQIQSLLDSAMDELCLTAMDDSLFATVEELNMQAREQRQQVDVVCRITERMKDCLASLKEETSESQQGYGDSSNENSLLTQQQQVKLPELRIGDKLYLCGIRCSTRVLDMTYIGFCMCLPLEHLQGWIWIFEHTSPRSRRFVLAVIAVVLAVMLPKLLMFPLQPPRQYPSAIGFITSASSFVRPSDDAIPFYDDVLTQVLL